MATMENSKVTEAMLYRRAKKQAKEIKSFYSNLMCYCIVIPTLVFINLMYTPEHIWFIYSALGWGIGLAFHGMAAFKYSPFLGKDWEQRKVKELIEKENHK